jgi:probable phosphoglycerate mutase
VRVIVEADGGSRGNPGPAGYGAVVFAGDHQTVLAERHESLGVATNNVAEYRGLIAGLTAARELGAAEVEVRMDSKLVVEQMSGRWKVKHPDMIPLAKRASELAAQFGYVSFTWIPRAQNAYADRLANEAMDAAADATATRDTGGVTEVGPQQPLVQHGGGAASWLGRGGATTRLLLLRHGQTELSVQRRYSGRGNPPLTEVGREQARRAAKRLAEAGGDIAAVISSPLDRALVTAETVAGELGLPVRTADRLIETDFGAWEGLTFAEAAARDPRLHAAWIGDPTVSPPGGESFEQVTARIRSELADLLAAHPGQTVLLVSHVTPIKTLLRLALDAGPSLLFRLHLDLASLSIADFYPDGVASVRLVNDTAHLR